MDRCRDERQTVAWNVCESVCVCVCVLVYIRPGVAAQSLQLPFNVTEGCRDRGRPQGLWASPMEPSKKLGHMTSSHRLTLYWSKTSLRDIRRATRQTQEGKGGGPGGSEAPVSAQSGRFSGTLPGSDPGSGEAWVAGEETAVLELGLERPNNAIPALSSLVTVEKRADTLPSRVDVVARASLVTDSPPA